MARKVDGAQIRGGRYYLNIRIPVEARAAFDGKTHLRDALKTADPKVAEQKVTLARAQIIEAENSARQGANLSDAIAALPADQRRLLDDAGGLDGLLKEYERSRVAAAFTAVGDDYGEPLDPREARLQEAQDRAAHNVMVDEAKREAKALTALGQAVAPLTVAAGVTGLRELAAAYCEAKNTAPGTREAIEAVVRRFIEYHGDVALEDLTTAHLREYATAAKGLPRVTSSKKLRGMAMPDLLRVAKAQGLETIGESTLDRHVSMLKALTAFAVPQGFMITDPWAQFKVIRPRTKHATKTKARAPFVPTDAARILAYARNEYDPATIDRWAPVLACYQGARREEIGQMVVGDIFESDGVWAMRITDLEDGQRIKNAVSLRTIPLHPKVIAEGFTTFAKGQGGRDGYLFSEKERWSSKLRLMTPDARERVTERYGKRFSRMLREKLDIKDGRYVFHSFRHLWEDAAEDAEMPQTHRRALAGRSKAGDSQAGYGDGPQLKALAKSLAKIDPLTN